MCRTRKYSERIAYVFQDYAYKRHRQTKVQYCMQLDLYEFRDPLLAEFRYILVHSRVSARRCEVKGAHRFTLPNPGWPNPPMTAIDGLESDLYANPASQPEALLCPAHHHPGPCTGGPLRE